MVSINSSVNIDDDGSLDRFIKNAEKMGGHVEVGWLASQTHIGRGGGKRSITMADLAAIHYHGVPSKNIPKRDVVTPALEQNQEKYFGFIERSIPALMDGSMDLRTMWEYLGMEGMADIQKQMVTARLAPLHPRTIKRKGSSRPLIDSGQLRQGVTYIVSEG
ncbi:hypothetical protein WCE01_01765 [Acinetobacter indicus]|uniref:hypothetical protein n=1 Tax=Acinetobacter indicus TaxID=756892 RepID=UPI0034D42AA6